MLKGHPKGLISAALSNMGERFGYYIMNAVLTLFLCSKFGLSDATAAIIYSCFYCGIYILSLVGGIIADKTQNYKGTIQKGLLTMAAGYILLAIPITATSANTSWLLPLTCFALLMIAFGNGLFKGNLQAIVGQMYDNFEAEEAKKGPEALKIAKEKRDSGFQIFYVFINIGGLIAPFVAPLIRSWWLKVNGFIYNAKLPALCHEQLSGTLSGDKLENYTKLSSEAVLNAGSTFDPNAYLEVFNQGVHFSFIASVLAMLISLTIFLCTKKGFPTPAKKAATESVNYTPEEKAAMAKEIKQRLYLVLIPPKWCFILFVRKRLYGYLHSGSRVLAGNQSVLCNRFDTCHHGDFRSLGKKRKDYFNTSKDWYRYGIGSFGIHIPCSVLICYGLSFGSRVPCSS